MVLFMCVRVFKDNDINEIFLNLTQIWTMSLNCSYKNVEEIHQKWKMQRHLINALIMHQYECVKKNYISVKEVNYRRVVCLRYIDYNSLLFWICNSSNLFILPLQLIITRLNIGYYHIMHLHSNFYCSS